MKKESTADILIRRKAFLQIIRRRSKPFPHKQTVQTKIILIDSRSGNESTGITHETTKPD